MSIYRRYILNEDWPEDRAKDPVKTTITALRKSLFIPASVKKAMKGGRSSIDISVEKWQRIDTILQESTRLTTIAALEPFIGANTCGLCLAAIEAYKAQRGELKDNLSKCEMCPLANIERCPDNNSVFSQIDKIVRFARNAPQVFADDADAFDQIRPLVKKLLEYLTSLQSA